MRIGVEAAALMGEHTGIWVYIREILSVLGRTMPPANIHLALGSNWITLDQLDIIGGIGHHKTAASPRRFERARRAAKHVPGLQAAWDRYRLSQYSRAIIQRAIDVMWAPCYLLPKINSRSVLSIHDLSHVRYPQYHPSLRLHHLSRLASAVERAGHIITVSNFSKCEIMEVYGLPADRISVIHNGVSQVYAPQAPQRMIPLLHNYRLEAGRYFLSVCTLEPRKNLRRVVEAYSRLPAHVQKTTPLVLVGGAGWGDAARPEMLSSIDIKGQLRFLGFVPTEALAALYSGCTAAVYSSLYEGFGIPVIEAMACGAHVIISDALALVEVADGHARVATHDSTAEWQSALEEAWAMAEETRTRICVANIDHAARFSWEDCALAHGEVLAAVAEARQMPERGRTIPAALPTRADNRPVTAPIFLETSRN